MRVILTSYVAGRDTYYNAVPVSVSHSSTEIHDYECKNCQELCKKNILCIFKAFAIHIEYTLIGCC